MLLGTHTPKLDDKGRVILPAKFRDDLGPDPHPLRPGAGEVRQGERLGAAVEDQKSPGITSCSMSEYVSSLLSA